jgi:hypothetical protein
MSESRDITVTLRTIDRASPILEIIARRLRMIVWRKGLAEAFSRGTHGYGRGERIESPDHNQQLGIWIPRMQGGRTLVTMGGIFGPLAVARSA